MPGRKGKSGGTRNGAGRPRSTTIEKNGRVAVPLDMANKITSRNGHTFERVACEPQDYFLVDGERFDHYHEAANEFQKRANPDRYTTAST